MPEMCYLCVAASTCRTDDMGLGILIKNHQLKRIICSFIGNCHELEKQYLNGDIEVVLSPQGSLAERIRAGGAGIPAFYTPTGFGTLVHRGEPVKFDHDHRIEIESRGKEVSEGWGMNEGEVYIEVSRFKTPADGRGGHL